MTRTMTALVPTAEHVWAQRSVPVPTPKPGQVLIRAAAAALNNADVVALDATDPTTGPATAAVAGYEVAGTVEATGAGVGTTLVGTRIMASTTGAFAQYVLADHRHAMPVPDQVTFENAAALPTALLTEHGALRTADFAAGQAVLITGATAAIALTGLQIARELGADTIIATTRSAAKTDLLRQCGADVVVDTASSDLTEAVLAATDGDGVDLVLDHVGGTLFAQTLAATRVHGTIVQVGRLDPTPPTINLDHIAYRRLTVRGVSFGAPDELAELLDQARRALSSAIAAGRIRPIIDCVLPLDEATEAAHRVRDGLATGKVILRLR